MIEQAIETDSHSEENEFSDQFTIADKLQIPDKVNFQDLQLLQRLSVQLPQRPLSADLWESICSQQ